MKIQSLGLTNIKPELLEVIKNLKIGDTIKGRLVDFLDNNATIKTSGGQNITAALTNDIPLVKGEFVELMINNIMDGKIFAELKTTDQTANNNSVLSDLLQKLDIPLNDKSLEAAKLLVRYNLPVNKDMLSEVINLQKSISNLSQGSTESKLGLVLSGLDVKNAEINVLSKIAVINKPEVEELISRLISSESEAKMTETLPIALDRAAQQNVSSNVNTRQAVLAHDNNDVSSNDMVKRADVADKGLKSDSTETIENKIGSAEKQIIEKESSKAATEQISKTSEQSRNITVKAESLQKHINNELEQAIEKLDIRLPQNAKEFVASIAKALSIISKSNTEDIVYLLSKDMEVTPTNLELLHANKNNEAKLNDFLNKLQLHIASKDNKQLIEIKSEIQRIFMHPRQIEDKDEVEEKLKDIIKLGEKIESAIKHDSIDNTDIKSTLANLKDNIDFLRSINQYNSYLQIPVLVNNDKTTADIYVFKDKKRSKSIDPQNATILVALDLSNIGHIESLITVNKRSVNVVFRVEDTNIGRLISKQTPTLTAALEAKGYMLNPVKVIKLEQTFNLLELEDAMDNKNSEKLHFDMKI